MAVEELGRRVERWVAAGVIGPEQGEAILALEGGAAEAGGGPGGLKERSGSPPADGGRRAVVVEVLGYLGGGLALVAGFVLGAESWAELGYWGRAGVLGAAVTTVLSTAGALDVSWSGLEGAAVAVLGAGWLELGRRELVVPRRT